MVFPNTIPTLLVLLPTTYKQSRLNTEQRATTIHKLAFTFRFTLANVLATAWLSLHISNLAGKK